MKKKVIWIGLAVVVLAVVGVGVAKRGGADEAPEVQTELSGRREIVQKVNANGKVRPRTQIKISADVSAKITKLAVKEGQWVDEGALLVDVRDIRELQRDGVIPGALHSPRGMLEFWIDPASPYFKPVFAEDIEFVLY